MLSGVGFTFIWEIWGKMRESRVWRHLYNICILLLSNSRFRRGILTILENIAVKGFCKIPVIMIFRKFILPVYFKQPWQVQQLNFVKSSPNCSRLKCMTIVYQCWTNLTCYAQWEMMVSWRSMILLYKGLMSHPWHTQNLKTSNSNFHPLTTLFNIYLGKKHASAYVWNVVLQLKLNNMPRLIVQGRR